MIKRILISTFFGLVMLFEVASGIVAAQNWLIDGSVWNGTKVMLFAAFTVLFVYWTIQPWRKSHGLRQPDQAGNSGAPRIARGTVSGARAGNSPPAPFQPVPPAGTRSGLRGSWLSPTGGLMMPDQAPEPDKPVVYDSVTNCQQCGAAHAQQVELSIAPGGEMHAKLVLPSGHECQKPDVIDAETVRRIQMLAAAGLSAEEIAGDLGVRVGWRYWRTDATGLSAVAVPFVWWVDRPTLAVCADRECLETLGQTKRGAMGCTERRPFCRVHAVKDRAMFGDEQRASNCVFGQVALWGDVIEMDKGWLATRAYPLALESKVWARAYRCVEIAPPP